MKVHSSFGLKFEAFGTKIEKEAEVKFSRREIIHELYGMSYSKRFNGLCFDNKTIINKKIGVKVADFNVFIENVESFFTLKENIVFLEFNLQGVAVNRFQKSATECSMHFHGEAYDAFG